MGGLLIRRVFQFNCAPNGVCADPPETPARVEAWQIVLTGLSVVIGMSFPADVYVR